MGFDPSLIDDDKVGEGHLDQVPLYDVLLAIRHAQSTGRLTIPGATGSNHMYFMRGQPVGVALAEHFHPLGQLLLELGETDAKTFVKAQRLIAVGERLPGQVFMELGVLDDAKLKVVLGVQSRKKAEEFCRMGARPFSFGKGLTFLSGFTSTPLDINMVLYIAVRQQMGPSSRKVFLDELMNLECHVSGDGPAIAGDLSVLGFGPAEERFLNRIETGFVPLRELLDTGALPSEDAAVLLRFLTLIGRLETRVPLPKPAPVSVSLPPTPAPVRPPPFEDVFSSGGEDALPQRGISRANEPTDPRRQAPQNDIHDVPTDLGGAALPARRPQASVIVAPELLESEPRPVRKKKVRRTEALPSTGTSAESFTRREKTLISPLPTIVIHEDEN